MSKELDQSKVAAVLAAVAAHPEASQREIARLSGVANSSVSKYLARIEGGLRHDVERRNHEVEVPELPDEGLDVQDIIARRKQQFAQLDAARKAREITPVNVKIDGPIGLGIFGDPHLDDDGTDIAKIEHDIAMMRATKGAFAINIGDTTNNWMGRLARLYAHQSTSESEAVKLAEWFVRQLPWLVFLSGNHNAWSGAGDPIAWMLHNCNTLRDETDVRISLRWGGEEKSRIYARHNFAGHSQWNATHGLAKAATMHGYDDPLLVCGHLHTDGYQITRNAQSGVISHLVRVSGYKVHDRYAKDLGLPNHRIGGGSGMAVIDPEKPTDHPGHVRFFFDLDAGVDYLNFLRKGW